MLTLSSVCLVAICPLLYISTLNYTNPWALQVTMCYDHMPPVSDTFYWHPPPLDIISILLTSPLPHVHQSVVFLPSGFCLVWPVRSPGRKWGREDSEVRLFISCRLSCRVTSGWLCVSAQVTGLLAYRCEIASLWVCDLPFSCPNKRRYTNHSLLLSYVGQPSLTITNSWDSQLIKKKVHLGSHLQDSIP
jgi:hypothetical protein